MELVGPPGFEPELMPFSSGPILARFPKALGYQATPRAQKWGGDLGWFWACKVHL